MPKDHYDDENDEAKAEVATASTFLVRKESISAAVTAVGQQRRETLNCMSVSHSYAV